uniref:Uncharacterized protein n=2 Tax=Anopheles funestus TaxID=62324 RepID=A0A4Y0B870_ANOFN
MKSTGTQRSLVKSVDDSTTNQAGVQSHSWEGSTVNKSNGEQLTMAGYQQRALSLRKPRIQRLLRHRYQEQLDQPSLHSVAKAKMMSRFTRIQVLSIIKLATMDKLRETGAGGPNDPTAQQRLSTEGGGAGGGGKAAGDGGSDEYHHQFYNTGRIGRRNALPDILGRTVPRQRPTCRRNWVLSLPRTVRAKHPTQAAAA